MFLKDWICNAEGAQLKADNRCRGEKKLISCRLVLSLRSPTNILTVGLRSSAPTYKTLLPFQESSLEEGSYKKEVK